MCGATPSGTINTFIKEAPETGGGHRGFKLRKEGTSDGGDAHHLDFALLPLRPSSHTVAGAILSPLSCHVEPLWLAVRFARRRLRGNA